MKVVKKIGGISLDFHLQQALASRKKIQKGLIYT